MAETAYRFWNPDAWKCRLMRSPNRLPQLSRLFAIRLEEISKLLISRALRKVTKFVMSPVVCFVADEAIHFVK